VERARYALPLATREASAWDTTPALVPDRAQGREFFIDNLLVRIHYLMVMIK